MMFNCPYSEDEIVERARSWVGKPLARATWRRGETCIHLASFSFGWEDKIPDNWIAWSMEDLAKLSGWKIVKRAPKRGDFGIFEIRGKEHLGICTGDGTFIHAGNITFVEARIDRFMKFYKGVLTWR